MKYIITILLFTFVSISVQAQNKIVINPATGTRNTISHNADSWFPDSVLMLPSDSTYPRINMTNYLKAKRLAAMQVDTLHNIVYIFNPHDTSWFQLNSSVLQYHTAGLGLLGSPFNGSVPQTWILDTAFIREFIINPILGVDTSIILVDSIICASSAALEGVPNLVCDSPLSSDTFFLHKKQIVTRTGGVLNYQTPTNGDQLVTASPVVYYQYSGTYPTGIWVLQHRVVQATFTNYGGSLNIGTSNNKNVNIGVKNRTIASFGTDSLLLMKRFIGSDSTINFARWYPDGRLGIGRFTPQIIYQDTNYTRNDSLFGFKNGGEFWTGTNSGGGSSERFGIEDNLGLQDRSVDFQNTHNFNLLNTTGFYVSEGDDAGSTGIVPYVFLSNVGYGFAVNDNTLGISSDIGGTSDKIRLQVSGVNGASTENRTDSLSFQFKETRNDLGTGLGTAHVFKIPTEHPFTPDVIDTVYMPITVNGNLADSTGNITISAGTGGISQLGSPTYGLTRPNDSTYIVDSATLSNTYVRHKDSSVAGGYYPYSTNPKGYLTANQSITVTATGDATGVSSASPTAPSLPLTLATVNSNVGSFGDATHVGAFTVNGKGLITAASSVAITGFSPTFTVTAPITYGSNIIGITQATTGANGYLSSTDWNTFNGKQAALSGTGFLKFSGTTPSYIPQIGLTADVTGILPVANGGTGTSSPGIVAGTNVTVTGTWPNQTINLTGGGGSQVYAPYKNLVTDKDGNAQASEGLSAWDSTFQAVDSVWFYGNSTVQADVTQSIIANAIHSFDKNNGASGTTLTDFQTLYNAGSVPSNRATIKWFYMDYGLNDVHIRGSYNSAAFASQYKSIVDSLIIIKGIKSKLVLVTPNAIGQNANGWGINSDSLKPYVDSIISIAQQKGVQVVDNFYTLLNYTGYYISSDSLHPNNLGYYRMAINFLTKVGGGVNLAGSLFTVGDVNAKGNINGNNIDGSGALNINGSATLGLGSGGSISNVPVLDLGAAYSNSGIAGSVNNLKIYTYHTGSTKYGIGQFGSNIEFQTGGNYGFYSSGTSIFSISPTAISTPATFSSGAITSTGNGSFGTSIGSGTNPAYISTGNSIGTNAEGNGNNIKLDVYGRQYGIGLSGGWVGIQSGSAAGVYVNNGTQAIRWFTDGNTLIGAGTTNNGSRLQTSSVSYAYVAKTTTYTITASDHDIEVTSGTSTYTLPTAVGITGREYWITNSGSGVTTLGTTSSQTFANVLSTPPTLTIAQFSAYRVVSNGTNWLAYKIVN